MSQLPLVSIICLCYNQEAYVLKALDSVLAQTYPNIELIVVDDASTDNSQQVIGEWVEGHPEISFLPLSENVGNCRAFNLGLWQSKGAWVVDLAADDVLLPQRIARQISYAQSLPSTYGALFSDAWLIDALGQRLRSYYPRNSQGKLKKAVPQGWVFPQLLKQAFICSPTLLFRREMLESLGGYNEELSYEDYDIWVRSGKYWQYGFQDEILMERRVLPRSLSMAFYQKKQNRHLHSTLKICRNALSLVETEEEGQALAHSVRYHLRQSVWMECLGLVPAFADILRQLGTLRPSDRCLSKAASWPLPWYGLYQGYLRARNAIPTNRR